MHRIAPSILSAEFVLRGGNVRSVIAAGTDCLVAGSTIFSLPDCRAVIDARRAEPTGIG